jgi:hypothetical protein
MSVQVGDYTYLFVDGALEDEVLVAKPRKTFPLESDTSVYFQEEDYMQFIDFYSAPAPSTIHPKFGNLYFVKDTPVQDVGGGVGKWTRTYALLPGVDANGKKTSYTHYDYESFGFRVPGITSSQDLFLVNSILSYNTSGGTLTITSTAAHDVVAGKGCSILYLVTDPVNNFVYSRYAQRVALAGTGGSTLIVRAITDINTVRPQSFTRAMVNSDPYTKVVASRIDTDFWLPTVNVTDASSIEIIDNFQIIDNQTGNRTEYLSDTTNPTIDQYRDWVEDGLWIVAESSVLRRWNSSDILQRVTRYVKAIL